MTDLASLRLLLESIAAGQTDIDTALQRLKFVGFEAVDDFAKIDHHRSIRNGFPEFIWGADKTPEHIARIMNVMRHRNQETGQDLPIVATLIKPEVFSWLKTQISGLTYYPTARICAIVPEQLEPKFPGLISIVTAGTSDLPVAEEAALIAELSGFQVKRLWDVGVAGIHRLLSNLDVLAEADVVIVVAGMEGALPSVVGGLVDCPVIAVPTSVGYGASFHGLSALLTMLSSCSPGIGVMNIDNGFGAAILAGRILRTLHRITANNKSSPS